MENIFCVTSLLPSIYICIQFCKSNHDIPILTASYPTSLNVSLSSTDVDSVTLTWRPVTSQTVKNYEVSILPRQLILYLLI